MDKVCYPWFIEKQKLNTRMIPMLHHMPTFSTVNSLSRIFLMYVTHSFNDSRNEDLSSCPL